MIGDTVAIEVPETVSARDLRRALGACEAALGDDRCAHLDVESNADQDWAARVSRTSVSDLTIELAVFGSEEPVVVRVLHFEEDEPEAFRWQSVGVVVAALVLSREAREEPLEPASEETNEAELPRAAPLVAANPRPGPSRPPNRERSDDGRYPTLDVAALVGAPVSEAPLGGGGWLGVRVPLVGPLLAVTQLDLSWSRSTAEETALRGLSFGASLGLGLRATLGHPQVFGELSARGALQSVRVLGEASAARETAWTARWGGRAGALLSWFPGADWGLVAGGDVGLMWPPLDVSVAGREPVRVAPLVWGGYLGLRVRIKPL